MGSFDTMRLVYLLTVLAILSPLLFVIFRERNVLLRNLAVWLGVATAAALLYLLVGPV
jgi:hypothetical protein